MPQAKTLALLMLLLTWGGQAVAAQETLTPVIDGEWWQVAGDPDLGEYTRDRQQPVDFCVWQARDGTWQLWSCIRGTGCGGHTRLFYGWEGANLTDIDWTPRGIVMEADPAYGESPGGLQAPHVVKFRGLYVMTYGDWVNICFATSEDGKRFTRRLQPDGTSGVFSEGPEHNTRDAMLIQIDGTWHCYYTASPSGRGYGYCRTSPDLLAWSHSSVVSYGGRVGPGPWQNECPHVVEVEPGVYYYFRNQYYGERARNWVYCSSNPFNFGIDEDSKLVRSWHLAAPEIIYHQGQYYIAALMDNLKGIKMARLKWVRLPEIGQAVLDFESKEGRDMWSLKSGNVSPVFTNSKRRDFRSPTEFFVGTAETGNSQPDDSRRCVIESPSFVVKDRGYVLLVSGGQDVEQLYVALIEADSGKELARVTGTGENTLTRTPVDCSESVGIKAFIRIVDNASGPWGHINFGGVFADPLAPYRD